ncbi:hypothetical protein I5L79_12430 [Hymenobacter sp. BT594]|uniref:Uncharacterized protein n=1 Tax=Hymenobacter guriensis TaxID=2793065 RepID=A0ABS0L2M8_9BACT|nr:hypothetical protein [Hymenobacter guriensis]
MGYNVRASGDYAIAFGRSGCALQLPLPVPQQSLLLKPPAALDRAVALSRAAGGRALARLTEKDKPAWHLYAIPGREWKG